MCFANTLIMLNSVIDKFEQGKQRQTDIDTLMDGVVYKNML